MVGSPAWYLVDIHPRQSTRPMLVSHHSCSTAPSPFVYKQTKNKSRARSNISKYKTIQDHGWMGSWNWLTTRAPLVGANNKRWFGSSVTLHFWAIEHKALVFAPRSFGTLCQQSLPPPPVLRLTFYWGNHGCIWESLRSQSNCSQNRSHVHFKQTLFEQYLNIPMIYPCFFIKVGR